MKIRTLKSRLVIAVAIGAILSATAPSFPGTIVHSAPPEETATGNIAYSGLFDGFPTVRMRKLITDPREMSRKGPKVALSAQAGAVVTEWNQEAVRLTLLPASALAPVQQGRVMAIVR